jgi:ABC-type nickel/cobalt efflux system permease component RcnA
VIRALALAVLCVAAAPAAAQNPWGVGATPSRPPAPAIPASGEGGTGPAFMRPLVERVAQAQREMNRTISREMRAVRETGSTRALLAITTVAFLYGVLHAVGPGHGKLVVSSFFLAREARLMAGLLTGTAISLLQAASSIMLVCGLAVALGQHGFDVLGRSVWVEALSYALIVVIGLAIAGSAARGHHHEHGGGRVGAGMIVAAGITPCASALIIMLFALTNGVLLVGIGATLVMAVGMSLTVSVVGILSILGRRTVMVVVPGSSRLRGRVSTGLSVAGGLIIAVIGSLLLAGAWARLG